MAFRAQRAKFGLEGGDSGAVVFSPAGLRPLRLFASEALLFSLCLRIHLFFFFSFPGPPLTSNQRLEVLRVGSLHPRSRRLCGRNKRRRTHAQTCNSFAALCLAEM